MVSPEELHLDENQELDETSEDVQADLQALECFLAADDEPF